MSDGGRSTMVGMDDAQLARLSEIQAMRSISDAMKSIQGALDETTKELRKLDSSVAGIKTDIAVMKKTDEDAVVLAGTVAALAERVRAMELIHAQQAGAGKLVIALKELGPWLVSLLIGAWALLDGQLGQ